MSKWHYSTLAKYKQITFGDIITENDLNEEICLKIGDDRRFFWLFVKNKEKFLINAKPSDFPIIILETNKYAHRNRVYNIVNRFSSVDFKPEKTKTFRAIVDDLCSQNHSEPDQQKISTITAVASYIDRINVRICAEKEFGKDSIYERLSYLKGDICVFNPESLPAIEYRLGNKVLVLNELGTLANDQRVICMKALLLMGGMNNTYEKAKRGGSLSSKDVYDISELSLCLMYNPKSYYKDEDMFFDMAFKSPALKSRFLPLYFTGALDINQFNINFDADEMAKIHQKDFIATTKALMYYKKHKHAELDDYNKEFFPLKLKYLESLNGRHKMHFDRILNAINLYADTVQEFTHLADLLLQAHLKYEEMNGGYSDVCIGEEVLI